MGCIDHVTYTVNVGTALEIPELGVKYLDMVNALEQYQLVHVRRHDQF